MNLSEKLIQMRGNEDACEVWLYRGLYIKEWTCTFKGRTPDGDTIELRKSAATPEEAVRIIHDKWLTFMRANPEFDPNRTIEYQPVKPKVAPAPKPFPIADELDDEILF